MAQEIIISYEQLKLFLNDAENFQCKRGTLAIPDSIEAGIRKKPRLDSPPEELDSPDEREFERLKSTKFTQAEERDEEWR